MTDAPTIYIYPPPGTPLPHFVPSAPWRAWLPSFAALCGPLLVGCGFGWTLLSPNTFRAVWRGDDAPEDVHSEPPHAAVGHFGSGILTVHLPWAIRTSPDIDLWVGPVPNYPIDGWHPLTAVIETSWHDGGFTLNFRLTRPYKSVVIREGTPLAQFVPYPRGWLESVRVELLTEGPEHAAEVSAWQAWQADRNALMDAQRQTTTVLRDGAYRRGERHTGPPAPNGPPSVRLRLAELPGQSRPKEF